MGERQRCNGVARSGIQCPPMQTELSRPLAGKDAGMSAPGWLRLALADLRRHPWRVLNPLLRPLYRWYEHDVARQIASGPVPAHIGLILDGNRRFARGMGLEATLGHQYGVNKLREVLEWCIDLEVRHVTLYVFSTENFGRPAKSNACWTCSCARARACCRNHASSRGACA